MFRIIEAMEKKLIQYNKWLKADKVKSEWLYIIALNTGTIAASTVPHDYSPAAMSVLALGESGWTIPINMETGESTRGPKSYIGHKPNIKSPSGVEKPSDWFLTEKCP
jgi:hypothetical protein